MKFRDARLFVIATEGQRTEPAYFRALMESLPGRWEKLSVEVVPPDKGRSAPSAVLAAAKRVRDARGATQPFDETWCVLDVDHRASGPHLKGLTDTVTAASQARVHLAFSNPCFELWYLLHFTNLDPAWQLNDCSAVASRLTGYTTGQRLRSNLPEAYTDRLTLDAAIARADAANADEPWPAGAGTRVGELMKRLLDALR